VEKKIHQLPHCVRVSESLAKIVEVQLLVSSAESIVVRPNHKKEIIMQSSSMC